MTDEDDRFDVDRALGRLARRVAWLRWGALGGLAVCAALAWSMAGHLAFLWSDPLHPVVSAIDIPLPTLHARGTMERGLSATERSLSILGALMCLVTAVAWVRADNPRRPVVLSAGGAMLSLVMLAQWTTSGEQFANRDIERLARAGAYQELWHQAQARPRMPYADYIGAQALLLAGDHERLRSVYGDWLRRWSEQGTRMGYVGHQKLPRGVPAWEGSHASPHVMRALEIAAFGKEVTPFARPYLRNTLNQLAHARKKLYWQVPVLLLAGIAWLGVLGTWRCARRNLRLAEEWVVRFDYYQAVAAPPAPHGVASLRSPAAATGSP